MSEQLTKVCLKQYNDLDSVFYNLQIVKVENQDKSDLINEPLVFNIVYKDEIKKNEISPFNLFKLKIYLISSFIIFVSNTPCL